MGARVKHTLYLILDRRTGPENERGQGEEGVGGEEEGGTVQVLPQRFTTLPVSPAPNPLDPICPKPRLHRKGQPIPKASRPHPPP